MKVALSILMSLLVAPAAFADDSVPSEGELHVTLKNAEYVKVQLNGEDWDNVEFERNGKVVVIKGIPTSNEKNAVTLLPQADSGLAQADVLVQLKDFKKKRVGRVLYFIATTTVTFTKAPTTPPPTPDAPPKQPDVAPPPPEKDDL